MTRHKRGGVMSQPISAAMCANTDLQRRLDQQLLLKRPCELRLLGISEAYLLRGFRHALISAFADYWTRACFVTPVSRAYQMQWVYDKKADRILRNAFETWFSQLRAPKPTCKLVLVTIILYYYFLSVRSHLLIHIFRRHPDQ